MDTKKESHNRWSIVWKAKMFRKQIYLSVNFS